MGERSDEKAKFERTLGFSKPQIRLAKRVGMLAYELYPMHRHCVMEKMYVIVRTGNEVRREHVNLAGAFAKHGGIKEKTSNQPTPGLIVFGKDDPKPQPPEYNEGLFNDMFKDGVQRFYSDIDLMSAWRHRGEKLDTNSLDFQYLINIPLGREVMHGGNDDFYDPETGRFCGHENVTKDDDFLVLGMNSQPLIISGMADLGKWYKRRTPQFFSKLKFIPKESDPVNMKVWPYLPVSE